MDAQKKDIDRVSVENQSNIGRVPAECRPNVGRVSADIWTDTRPILDRHLNDIRLILDRHSTDTIDRYVDWVSTDMSTGCRPIVPTDKHNRYGKEKFYLGHSQEFMG